MLRRNFVVGAMAALGTVALPLRHLLFGNSVTVTPTFTHEEHLQDEIRAWDVPAPEPEPKPVAVFSGPSNPGNDGCLLLDNVVLSLGDGKDSLRIMAQGIHISYPVLEPGMVQLHIGRLVGPTTSVTELWKRIGQVGNSEILFLHLYSPVPEAKYRPIAVALTQPVVSNLRCTVSAADMTIAEAVWIMAKTFNIITLPARSGATAKV